MQRSLLFAVILFVLPFYGFAETWTLDAAHFNFFQSSKILKEGSITEVGIGLAYTEKWGGELRFRGTFFSKNEELFAISDSLNAKEETVLEWFFFPAKYFFVKTENWKLQLGAGLYYEYNELHEKGFFDIPELAAFNPPQERVNWYTNDFSLHLAGPVAEGAINCQIAIPYLNPSLSISAGIVPVFFLSSSQNMGIVPLMNPQYRNNTQQTWGSPYYYLTLNATLFKYINIVLLYDSAYLNYQMLGFDDNLNWNLPERTVHIQSFKIEPSVFIPLNAIKAQIGYGYTFDITQFDSEERMIGNRSYLILAVKTAK